MHPNVEKLRLRGVQPIRDKERMVFRICQNYDICTASAEAIADLVCQMGVPTGEDDILI